MAKRSASGSSVTGTRANNGAHELGDPTEVVVDRGVGASTGQVPDTVEAMADDAYTFIKALGFSKIDIFSFSLGGFVAQALVVKHPDLVRKLVLTGTGPKGGKDIDRVAGTYFDMLRATLTRSDPKEFLFFNRDATGKAAGK